MAFVWWWQVEVKRSIFRPRRIPCGQSPIPKEFSSSKANSVAMTLNAHNM